MIDRERVLNPLNHHQQQQIPAWIFGGRHAPFAFGQFSSQSRQMFCCLMAVLTLLDSLQAASIIKRNATTPSAPIPSSAITTTQFTTISDNNNASSSPPRSDGVVGSSSSGDGRRPGAVNSEHPTSDELNIRIPNRESPTGESQRISVSTEVESLVKQWAPLVWLAPSEQFMPGNVNEFLSHVHAEKPTPVAAGASTIHQNADILDVSDDMLLYELDREIGVEQPAAEISAIGSDDTMKFDSKSGPQRRFSFGIDLPIGMKSQDWFLVSNTDIDTELLNHSSFLYGQDPNKADVPIYSTISFCNAFENTYNSHFNEIGYSDRIDRNPFIPISSTSQDERFPYKFETPISSKQVRPKRMPRQVLQNGAKMKSRANSGQNRPHFHVTYWMFYPYNQGKTICTLNLGPLGRLPIPVIFGKCLGARRDFGSHVGDWEHMTLYFRGQNEPEEMYVSAHDAGAYYSYDRLSGSFEFRRQETRKGILQHPNFPKTVRTINNHPVLFSAQGSHGLWTAPGKHRFVRLPRLVDINGFGTPWHTWKNIEFSYDTSGNRAVGGRGRSMVGPQWLQFMGKWGNPKSKCHPLKRLGLNFCEYNDGPTGIPMKEPHFVCK